MPYDIHEDATPLSGEAPVQEQAKAASPGKPEVVTSTSIRWGKKALANQIRLDPEATFEQEYLAEFIDSPEAMPGIVDLAIACAAGNTRYLSQLTSKCSVCGYEETLDLPHETSAEDMQLAMQETLLTPCPSCEESLQAQIARNEPGLELLDEDGETTILDIQLPD